MKKGLATTSAFLAGLSVGFAVYHGALTASEKIILKRPAFDELQSRVLRLEAENQELTEELLRPREPANIIFSRLDLPYDEQADAALEVRVARTRAQAESRFLMVTFGANWCLDCRTLYHTLNSPTVTAYTRDLFHFVNVDIGNFNRNHDVAESLGVSLTRGIPVAIVFNPDGEVIGTTNKGQLEPARHYTSQQILKFVRDIAERSRISAPDSVD